MRSLQHAISALLTLFFRPRTDGRVLAPWGVFLFWVVVVWLFGLLVYWVG